MPLTYMYITNRPQVARIAQTAGVNRVWIDLEYMGKDQRQKGMDSVKSRHQLSDIRSIRPLLRESALQVRVNPLHDGSQAEITAAIDYGADIVMLPMWKTADDVKRFVELVDGRARVLLLLETKEADRNLARALAVKGVDEIHIGLNDLHLSYQKKFMFELLSDGTVERLCRQIGEAGLPYGFGGVAKLGGGAVPAELVLAEHYRLGSSMAILARSFCNSGTRTDFDVLEREFDREMKSLRDYETFLAGQSKDWLAEQHKELVARVDDVVRG